MNRLLKYILIVNIALILLGSIAIFLGMLHESYQDEYASKIQIEGGDITLPQIAEPRQTPTYIIGSILTLGMFWGFPIFIILMSGIYLSKKPTSKEYGKSLLVPASYCLLSLIVSLIWFTSFAVGEEGMAALFIWVQLLITFISVAIVNSVILFTRKK